MYFPVSSGDEGSNEKKFWTGNEYHSDRSVLDRTIPAKTKGQKNVYSLQYWLHHDIASGLFAVEPWPVSCTLYTVY